MSIEGTGAQLGNLNYTVHDPYNGTTPTGGDSLRQNLNVFYEVHPFRSTHAREHCTDNGI